MHNIGGEKRDESQIHNMKNKCHLKTWMKCKIVKYTQLMRNLAEHFISL